jgi:hypothetical protein
MNKMFVHFALAIALGAIILTQPGRAKAGDPGDFSMGGFVADSLAEYLRHMEEARKQCDESSRRVQVARSNYQAALQSGTGIESARGELYRLLDSKDFLYFGIYVISGRNSPQTQDALKNCVVDGGIRSKLSAAFFDLVGEVRERMGARGENDIVVFDPQKLVAAIEAERPRANAYVHARNLMEFYESGVPTERVFSAEAYLKILLEMEYSRPTLSVLQPDMDKLPQQRFDLAIEVFGKEMVMQAAETVLKLPKTAEGKLVRQFTADNFHGTFDPFKAFNAILKNGPKGFVIFSKFKNWRKDWAGEIEYGAEYYDELVSLHGVDRVHQVVESIRAAPRIFGGKIGVPHQGAYKTESDLWYLEELLNNPNTPIVDVDDFVYVAASDTEAIINSKGKIQIIYGRINDVRWVSGDSNDAWGRVFYIYFADVSKFGLWFTDASFRGSRGRFGNDAKGLIGKLIRVDGFVQQTVGQKKGSIQPDWHMRISDGYYRIIAEEDWPDYLPIPEMQPARSLDELKAAVTPVEVEQETESLVDKGLAVREAARAEARRKYPGTLNCREIKSMRKTAFTDPSSVAITQYLYQIALYTTAVAKYEIYREVCSGVPDPAVRRDYLQIATGDLAAKYTDIIDQHVESEYQAICPLVIGSPCSRAGLEDTKSDYREVMAVLKSGDLQRERDRLLAHEESSKPKTRTKASRANSSVTAAPAKTKLPASWKKYAKTVGKYEALSEACSGELEAAIRDEFLAALESATDDQQTALTTVIERSYEQQRDARQNAREPCHKNKLKRAQADYQKMMSGVAGEELSMRSN